MKTLNKLLRFANANWFPILFGIYLTAFGIDIRIGECRFCINSLPQAIHNWKTSQLK